MLPTSSQSGNASGWYLRVNDFARSTPWLHGPVRTWAEYGVLVFALLLVAGWWTARSRDPRTMAAALVAPVSVVLAVAINQPIIKAVSEARPFVAFPHALVLVTRSADPSFPSDHATMAGAVAAGLFIVGRRLGLLAAGCAVAMALARVYVGVHYPRDVAAGLVLGATVATVCWTLLRRPAIRLVEVLRQNDRTRALVMSRRASAALRVRLPKLSPPRWSTSGPVMVPAPDQRRNVGLMVRPGAFAGFSLAGATPLEAARPQLLVALGMLAAESVAVVTATQLLGFRHGAMRPERPAPTEAPSSRFSSGRLSAKHQRW